MKFREYKNGNVVVIVRPAAEIGLATIFDKDIWLYAIAKRLNFDDIIYMSYSINFRRKVIFTMEE
ncbi:replication initiator protein A, partial [Arsenophonus endosymbiont of Bemisia tabaci]|uniref:replication initiator protein A n=1 Tax=Arsenophonus endosymbiont of Bemisia tabaci TaxID=536059 RepID=UPI0030B82D1D